MNLSPLTARSMSFLPQPQISEMSSAHQTPTKTGRSLPATAAALHAVEGESKGENVERAAERIVSLNQTVSRQALQDEGGSHPYWIRLNASPAKEEDFQQDRGQAKIELQKIPPEYPLLVERYRSWQKIGFRHSYDPDGQYMQSASMPGIRSGGYGAKETPPKGLGPGSSGPRSHISSKIEDNLITTALSRFNPAFQDLVIAPEDIALSEAIFNTTEWLKRGKGSSREKFLAMNAPKRQSSFHEDEISKSACNMLEEITVELRSRMGETITSDEQPRWSDCGKVPLPHKEDTPQDSISKRQSHKPDMVLKRPFRLVPADDEKRHCEVVNPVTSGNTKKRKLLEDDDDKAVSIPNKKIKLAKSAQPPKLSKLTHAQALMLLEMKKRPTLEMKVYANNGMDKVVPRTLRYSYELIRNNAIAGRVTTATITGTYIRLYFTESFSFSTTRLYNIANEDHLYDIVKLVAFLIGPSQNVLQSWQPDVKSFSTRISDTAVETSSKGVLEGERTETMSTKTSKSPGAETLEVLDTSDTGDEEASHVLQEGTQSFSERRWFWVGGFKQIFRDAELFGRRTAVWTGMTCADKSPGQPDCDPFETVIKGAWLPPGLRWHEHKMLDHLDPKQAFKPSSRFAKLDEDTKREVYEHLPTSIGLLDADMKTSQIPPELHGSQNAFAPPLEHLELVVLGMHGPIGEMVDRELLTIIELSEVHLGTSTQHWYNATRDVHFRDTSPGNVVYRRVEGNNNTKTRGKIVGFLIDYGNARFQNERRNPCLAGPWEGLCADDLRSGTPDFLCTAVLETDRNLNQYNETESLLQGLSDNPDDELERLLLLDKRAQCEVKLKQKRHRFIDDLESDLYVFIYQAAHPSRMTQADLQTLQTTLRDPSLKMVAWENLLFKLVCPIDAPNGFARIIQRLAAIVQSTRTALEKQILSQEDLPACMTELEDECFEKYHNTLKTWIAEAKQQALSGERTECEKTEI
ncbi:hypothetical protein FFLO_00012 [Filobasidium floriforme]|uniref:Uncharacterized protein n=1 Tax=Filobasidium floriforme TaxID=5210 RepID=A0A8K0JTL7_9TREE|nr:hypothetical protein FFLO_00012 [Filobasidium floriforme]